MPTYITLVHTAWLGYKAHSLSLFRKIISTGLKSRQCLINLGTIPKLSVKGIYSDEHQNIYFLPENLFKTIAPAFVDQMCFNSIYIKAKSNSLSVYNAEYRGDVSIFEYEASKISVLSFLKQFKNTQKLKNKIQTNGLEKVCRVTTHPLTAVPVIINKEIYELLNLFGLEDQEYGAEVIMPFTHIPSCGRRQDTTSLGVEE